VQTIKIILVIALFAGIFTSCTDNDAIKHSDTLSTGTISISVDETYRPIIEDELKVFDSSYPDAHIKASYKPEADCIKDFLNDSSVRLILVTRDLTADEKKVLEQKKIVATSLAVAKDAVAVVVNNSSPDSIMSVSQVKGILTGKFAKKYTVVFDNQGSSTLRYMLDSLIPGEKFADNVFAAKTADSVIDYVQKNEHAIGFIGVSHVADFSDPEGLAFIKQVKVVQMFNDKLRSAYGPYQAYIAPNYYPFTRSLYYIHKDTHLGLGTGFANFLAAPRGQLIFKSARLFPLRSNIIFREAAINK
jgi:phosphate transport system substrate-binding protein